jgi:transglutaminase-like putative cysteine protease
MGSYLDLFGNRVTRVEVPAGLVTFSDRFIIQDSGEPDETPPDVWTTPIADLPDEILLFLLASRYCDSEKLADFAWSQFGKLSGALCVQAICDFVHAKIRFSYPDASPTRCASDSMHEGIGVCRDFAHLAIALCRCMNIPAHPLLHRLSRRHRRSHRRQSDGFQRLVPGLSRWALAHDGCAS